MGGKEGGGGVAGRGEERRGEREKEEGRGVREWVEYLRSLPFGARILLDSTHV